MMRLSLIKPIKTPGGAVMETIKCLTGEDRRIALESIGRAAAEMATRRSVTPSDSARNVAIAMLEGVATIDGVQGPVVLLRGGKSEAELADELEALAAEYRQRHKKTEAFMEAAYARHQRCEDLAAPEPCENASPEAPHTPSEQQVRGDEND